MFVVLKVYSCLKLRNQEGQNKAHYLDLLSFMTVFSINQKH